MAGAGSVGSSVIYAAILSVIGGGPLTVVDPDAFDDRNRLRYPIVLPPLTEDKKVEALAKLAGTGLLVKPSGVDIQGHLDGLAETRSCLCCSPASTASRAK